MLTHCDTAPSELIDLGSHLQLMIEAFTKNIDLEYVLENIKMKIGEDGIITDKNDIIYELSTESNQFFEENKGITLYIHC